ncbi:GNAT family N-acetyltransferase [Allokutzneria albata]|uniref:Protein N-acetyltransferase, RimJ/RimL family n=1 Tax=Allokutzneria albata TaxID=211114 RepID=A0A1G9XPI1_ALLAB|nr:GNAT family N-acetyltransferase [Allokutzneria albata]SDM98674.1 Protein N-acetyltransferase, RimJ/RimL family [Allokutzneria albata]
MIGTDRLVLRRPTAADLTAMVEIHSDPETNRFNPLGPADEARATRDLMSWLAHWAVHGFGYCAITEPSGFVVGFGGLRTHVFEDEPVLNLYYRFRPSAWGKGYAPEMARAVVDWAREHRPEPVLIFTKSDNAPAIRVAEKIGFTLLRETVLEGAPAVVYGAQETIVT